MPTRSSVAQPWAEPMLPPLCRRWSQQPFPCPMLSWQSFCASTWAGTALSFWLRTGTLQAAGRQALTGSLMHNRQHT